MVDYRYLDTWTVLYPIDSKSTVIPTPPCVFEQYNHVRVLSVRALVIMNESSLAIIYILTPAQSVITP